MSRRVRPGFSLTEVLVASSLLLTVSALFISLMLYSGKGFKEVDDTLTMQSTHARVASHLRSAALGARFYRLYESYGSRKETQGLAGGQFCVLVRLHPVGLNQPYAVSRLDCYYVKAGSPNPSLAHFALTYPAPAEGVTDAFAVNPKSFDEDLLTRLNEAAPADVSPSGEKILAPLDGVIAKLSSPTALEWTFFTPNAGGRLLLVTLPISARNPNGATMTDVLTTSFSF